MIEFKSIRTRLVFWILLIALVPLSLAIITTYYQRVEVIESRTLEKLVAIRDLKVARVKDWLQERSGDLKTISTGIELNVLEIINSRDSLSTNSLKKLEKIRQYFMLFLNNHKSYSEIFIISPITGKIVISSNQDMEGKDKSDDDYFNKPLESKKLFIQDIYQSKTLLTHAMAFSIPIFCAQHDGSHVIGILVARIDLEHSLYPMLQDKVGLGKTGETLIVNSDVMALNELRFYEDAPLNLQIKAEPAIKASQGKSGTGVSADYRGEQVVAAYTYIPRTGWGFVSKQDLYELRAPIRELVWNAIILFTIACAGIVLVAIFFGLKISKPIVKMSALAKEIAGGNYSIRSDINSHDEVGSLGVAINHMVDV